MKIRFCKEQGSALTIVIVLGAVVGVMLAGYLVWASQHNVLMKRSQAWNQAIPVLEAGIEEALAHLYDFPDKRGANGWILSVDSLYHFKNRDIADDTRYSVFITNVTPPIIVSYGFVRAPLRSGEWIHRAVRVETEPRPLFPVAMGMQQNIKMNGKSIRIDSFNSEDRNVYSDAQGHWVESKRKDGGNISSNEGIFDVGNAQIWGKVATGPGGTLDTAGSVSVGGIAWHDAGTTGIQDGWSSADANFSFPPVPDPVPAGSGDMPTGGKVNGVTYTYVLDNGTWSLADLSGSVYVRGTRVKLTVGSATGGGSFSVDSSSPIVLGDGATLKLYSYTSSATISGNGVQNSGIAENFQYWGMPSNKTLDLKGGAQVRGIIYAPDTEVTLSGGGSTDSNLEGAVMARTFTLNGGVYIHYDEALKNFQPAGFIVISWNEI